MKNKVLITGINGFLGSHLAKHLKSDFEIIGLEHSLTNLNRIGQESFKIYESKEDILETIFKEHKIYAIIHVATVYRRKEEPILDLLKTNINLPVQLLELSNKYNVNLFLNTDSFFNNESYSYSYLSDYTLSKKHSVDWIKLLSNDSFTKIVNMKIFHMYGENDSPTKFLPFIVQKIKENEIDIDMTPGEQTRDFIYVKDVVSAYSCVLNSSNNLKNYQEFEVGTGISTSIRDLVLLIKEITNSKSNLNLGKVPYREGEIMESKSNISSLQNLGWSANYTLLSGLKNLIHEY